MQKKFSNFFQKSVDRDIYIVYITSCHTVLPAAQYMARHIISEEEELN